MTRTLPEGDSLLLRTSFVDNAAWEQTLAAVLASYDEDTVTGLTPVDDPAFDGLTLAELSRLVDNHPYVFLADATTMADPEHATLVVDTSGEETDYPTFRVAASAMADVEVNLFLANMDFEDYAESIGEDGVYRGFDTSA